MSRLRRNKHPRLIGVGGSYILPEEIAGLQAVTNYEYGKQPDAADTLRKRASAQGDLYCPPQGLLPSARLVESTIVVYYSGTQVLVTGMRPVEVREAINAELTRRAEDIDKRLREEEEEEFFSGPPLL